MSACLSFNKEIINLVFGLALLLLLPYISANSYSSAWCLVIDEWSVVRKVISRNIKRIDKGLRITKIILNQCNVGSSPSKKSKKTLWDQFKVNDSKPDNIQMSCTLHKYILIESGIPARQMQMMSLILDKVFTMWSEIKDIQHCAKKNKQKNNNKKPIHQG